MLNDTQRHIISIKAKTCAQCGIWFYYKRITKNTCSASCRKQHSRGIEPTQASKYGLDDREQVAAIIADTNPIAWRKLKKIQDFFGSRGVTMALDLILALD